MLAESDDTVLLENNHYFPADALRSEYFVASEHSSVCGWKGTASYYHIEVDGQRNADAAWYYAEPKAAAAAIRGRVAFWRGVKLLP